MLNNETIEQLEAKREDLRNENNYQYATVKNAQSIIGINCRNIDLINHQISVLEVLGGPDATL